MTEYFIGMHVNFDDEKHDRDFTSEISGIEFCNFDKKEEIQRMIDIHQRDKFKIGIHFPLDKSSYKYRDPLLLSLDKDERLEALEAVEKELRIGKDIGVEYLLIHFPKPMVVDKSLEWSKCYFSHDGEIVDETQYSFDLFRLNCHEVLNKLSKLSKEYELQIVLELDILNKYFYNENLLEELLNKYTNIKLCLDSARFHVISKIDNNFDWKSFIEKMAKYTYLLHISNIMVTDKLEKGHHPVSKDLKIEDGWGNTGEFLEIISSKNKDLKILFEHRSDILSDDELNKCYQWVMSFFK